MEDPCRRARFLCGLLCLAMAGNAAASDYERGMICFREGRFAQARALFESAARLEPDSPDVWKALGLTLLRLNDYAAAADPMRHACELGAAGDDSCYLEGRILFVLA